MSSADNYRFNLVDKFLGYSSAIDKTNCDPRLLVKGSKNIYKKVSGTLAVRPGLKRRGAASSTLEGVKSSFEWETSKATIHALRVANSKLEVESDIVTSGTYVWYTLLSSLTTTLWVFDTMWDNTLKKDFLVFVGGNTSLYRWEGGMAKISSTTANTIVLDRTVSAGGYSTTSGSVVVNGTTYTYSGSSASTLTGVSGNPSGEANASVVISTIITNATTPASDFTNDFLKVIGNQVYVGSYTSRFIYISSDSSYINNTVPALRAPGDPELLTLDSLGKGIGVRQGKAIIFGGDNDLSVVSFNQVTVGSTLTEQTVVDKKEMAALEAPLNHNFITNIGDDLIWVSQKQQLKVFGDFRNFIEPVFPTLSVPVEQEWYDENFTGGHLRAVGDLVYATAPNNGRVWLYRQRVTVNDQGDVVTDRYFETPFIWNISRIAVIDGVEYGHSNANPQIYQMWTDQYHDDSPSDEDLAYDCVATFAYQNSGKRTDLINFNKTYYELYLSQGSEVKCAVILDYQGSSGVLESVINSVTSPGSFFTGDVGVSLGDSSLGDSSLGEGISEDEASQETLVKCRVIVGVSPVDVFEYQLRVFSDSANARFEIIALGSNAQISTRYPTHIQK